MGTQQFIFAVVGVVVVGFAIAVGVSMVDNAYTDRMSELLINKVVKIGQEANEYRKRPISMGGGGGSYKGFEDQVRNLLKDEDLKSIKIKGNKKKLDLKFELKGDTKKSPKVNVRYKQDGIDRLRYYDPNDRKWVWYIKKGDILEEQDIKPKRPQKPQKQAEPQRNSSPTTDLELASIN